MQARTRRWDVAPTGRDDWHNGRTGAGNTPAIEARMGQDVALHVIGMDNNFHDFHIHGHRWKDAAGTRAWPAGIW